MNVYCRYIELGITLICDNNTNMRCEWTSKGAIRLHVSLSACGLDRMDKMQE